MLINMYLPFSAGDTTFLLRQEFTLGHITVQQNMILTDNDPLFCAVCLKTQARYFLEHRSLLYAFEIKKKSDIFT
jgi:hypothetical protein